MAIKSDRWIREMSEKHGMIEPYAENQVRLDENGQKLISYGVSSYGYDVRCAREFKVFTNVHSAIVDPKNFDERSFIDIESDVCIIPPNSFALARTIEYFRIPRNVLTVCLGKSTYARCGIIVNVTPLIKLITEFGLTIDKFINVIHDGLDISKMSTIGAGVLINSKVSIAAHTKIGNFVSINRNVSIGHHTTIGDYCSINPGTNIAGNVTIGEGTTIGMGVNIIDGIKIGKNTIIGAGSVVTKDIPDNVVAYGSPCKIIRDNG